MKLIDSCGSWYRLWSIQLAGAAGLAAAAVVANPSFVLSLIALIPESKRGLAAVLTGLLTFVLPAMTRLIEQPGTTPDNSSSP